MKRRTFLFTSGAAAISTSAASGRPPRILLRSSWQAVNIGDVAHSPGVLALLEKYLPEAEVRLWAGGLPKNVTTMLMTRFPKLVIVTGSIGDGGKASNKALGDAVAWADFLLHGSGPFLVGRKNVAAWRTHVRKPYGVYGITFGSYFDADEAPLLSGAEFVYFRDSVSLAAARKQGVKCPVMEFGPDGAFGTDLRDDEKAMAFLKANGLEEGRFVCCIPRLRHTPYWRIKKGRALDPVKDARNEKVAEHDHAPLREAIAAVVRETEMKVLLCPEDSTQMAVGKRWIYDKLPDNVQKRVIWRADFWLPDEALSTYVRSAGLFGLEMHSPIMCIGNGVPAIVCRFAEQTSKGFMWRDIGLDDWLFDFDKEEEIEKFTPAVLTMIQNRDVARSIVTKAQAVLKERQLATIRQIGKSATL